MEGFFGGFERTPLEITVYLASYSILSFLDPHPCGIFNDLSRGHLITALCAFWLGENDDDSRGWVWIFFGTAKFNFISTKYNLIS